MADTLPVVPPLAAIKWITDKIPRPSVGTSAMPDYRTGFYVAHLAAVDQVRVVRDALARAAKDGLSFEQWRDSLKPADLGLSSSHLKTIWRNNVFGALNDARYAEMELIKDEFPFVIFKTAEDDKVRPSHVAHNNWYVRIGDPDLEGHCPMLDHNCRCQLVQVSEDEAKRLGGFTTLPATATRAPSGWGRSPFSARTQKPLPNPKVSAPKIPPTPKAAKPVPSPAKIAVAEKNLALPKPAKVAEQSNAEVIASRVNTVYKDEVKTTLDRALDALNVKMSMKIDPLWVKFQDRARGSTRIAKLVQELEKRGYPTAALEQVYRYTQTATDYTSKLRSGVTLTDQDLLKFNRLRGFLTDSRSALDSLTNFETFRSPLDPARRAVAVRSLGVSKGVLALLAELERSGRIKLNGPVSFAGKDSNFLEKIGGGVHIEVRSIDSSYRNARKVDAISHYESEKEILMWAPELRFVEKYTKGGNTVYVVEVVTPTSGSKQFTAYSFSALGSDLLSSTVWIDHLLDAWVAEKYGRELWA